MTPQSIKASTVWEYAFRVMVPVSVALSGAAIRNEIRSQDYDRRIAVIEQQEHDRGQLERRMLDELSAIRVAIARLEERLTKR